MTNFRSFSGHLMVWALAPVMMLAACDWLAPADINDPFFNSENARATRVWEEACPQYVSLDSAETQPSPYDGDITAIDCQILYMRALATPYSEAEIDDYRDLIGGDLAMDPDYLRYVQGQIFELLYVRWRLTGERLAELEAQARLLTKEEIDGALFLSKFDSSLGLRRKGDPCGRTAADDPGYRFVMMGSGPRNPPSCGPTLPDGGRPG